MARDDLQQSPMMRHLLDALQEGKDIGHYGRLTFAMVAHYFVDKQELATLLEQGKGANEQEIRALVQQVEARDYNPPSREQILQWQSRQDFPICPDSDDPNACNVYRELNLPDEVYQHIEEYRAEQFAEGSGEQ